MSFSSSGPQAPESSDFHERRSHPRVQLKAHGFSHVCQFQRSGRRHPASLVDISPGGARLLLTDDRPPITGGEALVLDTRLSSSLEDMAGIPSTVRWTQENDFGVSFDQPLNLGIPELQQLLAR